MISQEIPRNHLVSTRKYAITEKKKAELDELALQVLDAQHDVDQYQAIVSALTLKLSDFESFLATAENNRAIALTNKNQMNQLAQGIQDLSENSVLAFNEMVLADGKTKDLAVQVKEVMDKLIYAVEIINKLANIVISKKALNPLISDELISMIGQAGNDANNAVALTLVALKSTFAAQASNMESEATSALLLTQARALYHVMTGKNADGSAPKNNAIPLNELFDLTYSHAKKRFDQVQAANVVTTRQLNQASTLLNRAQIKLGSLQSGLAAANAAALAS